MIAMLLLLIAPLLALAPGVFINQSGTPKMLAIAVGLYLALRNRSTYSAAAQKQAFLFLGVCAVSWIFAENHWIGLVGSPRAPYYGLIEVAFVVLAYYAAAGLKDNPRPVLIWAGVGLGILAIAQASTGHSFLNQPLQQGRASGIRYSPVMFAASMIPCAICAWNEFRERSFLGIHWKSLLAFALIVAGIVSSQAKGAMLALSVALWVYETDGVRRWVGVAVSVAALWVYMLKVPSVNNLERLELLRISWSAFLERPLLGWGPDNFLLVMLKNRTVEYSRIVGSLRLAQASAHNDIAQVAATLGLVGLVSYLYLLWSLVRSSRSLMSLSVIVAMWFQAQVNPLPVDVLVIAAVLVGCECDTEDISWTPAWVAPCVLAAGVFMATMDLSPAVRGLLR